MYLFCELKKIVFCKYLFLRMASFWKFRVYKFQCQRKKNKKKTIESRDIQLMFLSRTTERKAGHDGKTVVIVWFWKKVELDQHFLCIFFFVYFREIWTLRILSVYLFSRMSFKRTFWFYLILQNRLNSHNTRKNINAKISTLKVDIARIPIRWRHQKLRIVFKKQF